MKLSDLFPLSSFADKSLADVVITGVSIDSRAVQPGELFVAIIGENLDGHAYLDMAIQNGAAAVLVSKEVKTSVPTITVADTSLALQQMANTYRLKWDIPIAAVTGSCGKTTTKNFIGSILNSYKKSLVTAGNFNNLFGLPLTLFRLNESHNYAVFEVGASYVGEIAKLAKILVPNIALITNAGASHLENMGGDVNAIAREKGSLLSSLPENGIAIINCDDTHAEYWLEIIGARKWYGFSLSSAKTKLVNKNCLGIITAENTKTSTLSSTFTAILPQARAEIKLNICGAHNIANALAAIATTTAMGIPIANISRGLEQAKPENGRLTVYGESARVLIDDSYNANPESFSAAIQVLTAFTSKKILLMGDMLELDNKGEYYHKQIGRQAMLAGVDKLFCFGSLSKFAAESFGASAKFYECQDQLYTELLEMLAENWVILVKGSRSMNMEKLVVRLKGLTE